MRYELTDYEWAAIKPMLPNKPRGAVVLRMANGRRLGRAQRDPTAVGARDRWVSQGLDPTYGHSPR